MTTSNDHPAEKQSILGSMPPKATFAFGLLSGIALTSIIAFVIVVSLGGNQSTKSSSNGSVAGATTNTAPVNANPTEPTGNPDALRAVSDDDHVIGPNNAPVTLIEFSDFQCPYCQRVHPTLQQLMDEYDGKIRWVYRHFPLEQIHPQARPAAIASECVSQLAGAEAFWEFAETVYNNQSQLGTEYFGSVAEDLGISRSKFDDCFASQKYDDVVQKDIDEGLAAGVQGTPATFINGQLISGALPYESFKAVIDQILAQK